MKAVFRTLGRFRGDHDPRFQGPHFICHHCDVSFADKPQQCPHCLRADGIDHCGGPRLDNGFAGCIRCNAEVRR